MNAEQIIRALASIEAPVDADYGSCGLCAAYEHIRVEGTMRGVWVDDPKGHEPDCPWRLARDWVAANPG